MISSGCLQVIAFPMLFYFYSDRYAPYMENVALDYQTQGLRIHRESSGTLRIDIPPQGIASVFVAWMNLKSPAHLPWALSFVVTCAAAPSIVAGVAAWMNPGNGDLLAMAFAAPVATCLGVGAFALLILYPARQEAHLAVTAKELSVEEFGIGDTVRFIVARESIESVSVQTSSDETAHRSLWIQCGGKSHLFLGHLPERELEEIAQALRNEIGLKP